MTVHPLGAIDWEVVFGTLEQIGYRGSFGIDIGGSESDVVDLDRAYVDAAAFVEGRLPGATSARRSRAR